MCVNFITCTYTLICLEDIRVPNLLVPESFPIKGRIGNSHQKGNTIFSFLGNYLLVTGLDEKPPNHNTYQSEVEVLEPNGTSKVLPAISNYPLEVTTSGDIVSNNIIICGGSKWPGTLTSACYILETDLRWKKVLIKVLSPQCHSILSL